MNIAPYIDHTLLSPIATTSEIVQRCEEAIQFKFAAICIPPYYVGTARKIVGATGIPIATVIGFPLGYNSIHIKADEIRKAIDDGAEELDLVINLAALKNQQWDYLSQEIATCLQPVRLHRKLIKVIIETGVLNDDEIINSCNLYAKHKVDFVKSSTGYASQGASVAAIKLMRANLPAGIRIKASGGIRTFASTKELIDAGADRIGTSAGVSIVQESFFGTP